MPLDIAVRTESSPSDIFVLMADHTDDVEEIAILRRMFHAEDAEALRLFDTGCRQYIVY